MKTPNHKPTPTISREKPENLPKSQLAYDTEDEKALRNKDSLAVLESAADGMINNERTFTVQTLYSKVKIVGLGFFTTAEFFDLWIVEQLTKERCKEIQSIDREYSLYQSNLC